MLGMREKRKREEQSERERERGRRTKTSGLTHPHLRFFYRTNRETIAAGNFLLGKSRDEFEGLEKNRDEGAGEGGKRRRPLKARKISKHDNVSNSSRAS